MEGLLIYHNTKALHPQRKPSPFSASLPVFELPISRIRLSGAHSDNGLGWPIPAPQRQSYSQQAVPDLIGSSRHLIGSSHHLVDRRHFGAFLGLKPLVAEVAFVYYDPVVVER